MDIRAEFEKALKGQPSRVILADISPQDLRVEEKILEKYEFAFGNQTGEEGMSRGELADLLDIVEEIENEEAEKKSES